LLVRDLPPSSDTKNAFRAGEDQIFRIYSQIAEQKSKGKSWAGAPVVRIERILGPRYKHTIPSLGELDNPFAKIMLTHPPPPCPAWEKSWQWAMFCDVVRVRGLPSALALLPEDRRQKYRAHLKLHKQGWWDPDAIWKLWPKAIGPLLIHYG
jgi:hypothetical protein